MSEPDEARNPLYTSEPTYGRNPKSVSEPRDERKPYPISDFKNLKKTKMTEIIRIKCKYGATIEYRKIPEGKQSQSVFRCPVHNDIIILPREYNWEFVRVLSTGGREFKPRAKTK